MRKFPVVGCVGKNFLPTLEYLCALSMGSHLSLEQQRLEQPFTSDDSRITTMNGTMIRVRSSKKKKHHGSNNKHLSFDYCLNQNMNKSINSIIHLSLHIPPPSNLQTSENRQDESRSLLPKSRTCISGEELAKLLEQRLRDSLDKISPQQLMDTFRRNNYLKHALHEDGYYGIAATCYKYEEWPCYLDDQPLQDMINCLPYRVERAKKKGEGARQTIWEVMMMMFLDACMVGDVTTIDSSWYSIF